LILLFCGAYFIINDLVYFIDWDIITLNGRSIMMTFLFDWISLLLIELVFIIYSLVILHSDNYMFGDLKIIRFISLVLIFVVSIIFLIVSPNVITAGLVTFRVTSLICLGSICKLTPGLFVAE
jgi:NADH-ubiquinone oxidoreductase chain 5